MMLKRILVLLYVFSLVSGLKKPITKANLDFADGLHLAKEFDEVFAITGDPLASVSAEELAEMHGSEKANALMTLDVSGNGILEAKELSSLFEKKFDLASRHELPNDSNEDGKLSRAEIRSQGFSEREVNTIIFEIDDDQNDEIETHEILEILAAVDENEDDELSRNEIEKVYPRNKFSAMVRFLAKFRRFGYLTPQVQVRRFWSVLKDMECICPTMISPVLDPMETFLVKNESHRPCLFDNELKNELKSASNQIKKHQLCYFPETNNSLLLTANDFRKAAQSTFMPIAHIQGDMTYNDFQAFIQNEPSHITGAISHLIHANALIMARSMLVQQLLFEGMATHFPSLVRDAARKRAKRTSNAQAQHLLTERNNAKLATFITQIGIIILIVLMLLGAVIYAKSPNAANWGSGAAAASDSMAEYQIIRAYFIGFLSKSTDDAAGPQPRIKTTQKNDASIDDPIKQAPDTDDSVPPFGIQQAALLIQYILVRDPPLLTLRDGADAISDTIWTSAFEAGNRDFEALEHDPELDPLDLVRNSLSQLNERRVRQPC